MGWKDNAGMFWQPESGGSYKKVSDHGRSSIDESVERIENKSRMYDGTLRRYSIAKKRTWSTSWENLPSTNLVPNGYKTVDGGMSGEEMEAFHKANDGAFLMILRRGSAKDKTVPTVSATNIPYEDANFYIVRVMITEFSKSVTKRGPVDFWDLNITLEEV
jgi:hypothetical protein